MENLAGKPEYENDLVEFRRKLGDKMVSLNDTFPESTWYRDNWIEDRIIKRTATMK